VLKGKGLHSFLLIFVSAFLMVGQEQFGMANSNYSPTATMFHNPSPILDSAVMLDNQVAGIGGFSYSNYAYLHKDEFSFLNNVIRSEPIPEAKFNSSRGDYSLYNVAYIHCLSATYQYREHGFSSRVRSFVDIRNVPELFANAINIPQINGQGDILTNILGIEMNASNVNIGLLSYGEYGFIYANAIKHRDRDLFIVGAAVKFLWGLVGVGVYIDNFDSSGVFSYDNLTAQTSVSSEFLGVKGWSGDIGFTYKKMLDNVTSYNPFRRETGCRIYNYKLKVGISIVDLVYVNLEKSTVNSNVKVASSVLDEFTNLAISNDPESFLTETLNVFDILITADTNSFNILVPAAFVFQYDFNFEKNNFFISLEYMDILTPSGIFGIQRPSVFPIITRYETRSFEFSLSFGMYNLEEVRSATMVRWGSLTIGSDKFGSFLGVSDATGFDLYIT
jgi:hypothetical protein